MKIRKTSIAALCSLLFACSSNFAQEDGLKEEGNSKIISELSSPVSNQFWWPEQLDLSPLRDHAYHSNPYGKDFNYAEEFKKLDTKAVEKDVNDLLTSSKSWWPADFGNYGPFFIRLSWHSAGTYRTLDGRGGAGGGQMRFDPLNSWPDNGNLDKARRLLWPIKQKYGRALSWSDLMVLAGTIGMKNMGFEIYGFAYGRSDDWEPDYVYWGPEVEMLASNREDQDGNLIKPLGATHMGLIYVNPEGPKGKPDPKGSAKNIRTAFSRMAMNDEETVALIAGGHTFGKMHGARKADCLGPEPAAADIERQGRGWHNNCGKGHSEDTTTSGLEGAWTQTPTKWSTLYLDNLLNNEWKQTKSPTGGIIWVPENESLHNTVPDAHVEGKRNPPVMTTADLALKVDPQYRKIAERFLANPDDYQQAFAKAWFKLTHRDMGPRFRYLGDNIPDEELIWQDPIPEVTYEPISEDDIAALKETILSAELTVPELIRTAWASAASHRVTDGRGGANGGRLRLEPQKNWHVNSPDELNKVLSVLSRIQQDFNGNSENRQVSLADLIVLGGAAALEKAAADAGRSITVPFTPGRTDASQQQTDADSFALLEPTADAFRNYYDEQRSYRTVTEMMVDKADRLGLTVPEMTVLLGGMRVLDANANGSRHGVLTDRPGTLSNDFFVNLLSMDTEWEKISDKKGLYQGKDRHTGEQKWTATPVDLIFGANAELRAVAEVYAANDAEELFTEHFIDAWHKVMNLDRQ